MTSPSTEFTAATASEQSRVKRRRDGLGLADRLPEGAGPELNAEESTRQGQQYEEAQVGDGKPRPGEPCSHPRMPEHGRRSVRGLSRATRDGPFLESLLTEAQRSTSRRRGLLRSWPPCRLGVEKRAVDLGPAAQALDVNSSPASGTRTASPRSPARAYPAGPRSSGRPASEERHERLGGGWVGCLGGNGDRVLDEDRLGWCHDRDRLAWRWA